MSKERIIRAQRIAVLKRNGYRRVWVDAEGRIAVEVQEERFSPEQHEMLRRVWDPEWPVVRSDTWKPPHGQPPKGTPDDEQFQFHSRQY